MDTVEFDIEFLALKLSENPRSPLFARLADIYLTKEQTVEALQLCQEGIQYFPKYYAGYIILGKTHLALKEYSKARTALQKALELSPFNPAVAQLIESIPNKPDEPTRTTDEDYFTPPAQPSEANAAAQPVNESLFDTMTDEEMNYEASPELSPSLTPEHSMEQIEQPVFSAPQETPISDLYADQPAQPTFQPFDEYFAEHQSKIQAEPAMTLDEYLRETMPSEVQQETETNILPREEASVASLSFEPEISPVAEPEQVFSSPEQAQLFADMTSEEPSAPDTAEPSSDIDVLAEKLQNVEHIVPQENDRPSEETETPETKAALESGMVTQTLAEIYASQGEYNAAIQAYEILIFSQPAKGAEYQKRIRELQQKQMEKDGFL